MLEKFAKKAFLFVDCEFYILNCKTVKIQIKNRMWKSAVIEPI